MLLKWARRIFGSPSKGKGSVNSGSTAERTFLTRPASFGQAYENWLSEGKATPWLDRLESAYNVYRAGMDPVDDSIDFMCFQSSAGAVICLQNEDSSAEEAMYLMEWMKDRVKALGYKLSVSDRISKGVMVKEKYYLKPPIHRGSPHEVPQMFGNITIELQFRNGDPANIKFHATHYHGRPYLPASPFEELLSHLWTA
jgi:hypothetical protein